MSETTELDLDYIGTEAARVLAKAEIEEEITTSQVRWLWDTIGELIGEIERLTR